MYWTLHRDCSEAESEAWASSQVCSHLLLSPLCRPSGNLFSLVPDSCPQQFCLLCRLQAQQAVSLLPTAAILLEMTGAAQIVVDFRDGEGPEEGVVCPARVWSRPGGEFSSWRCGWMCAVCTQVSV